MRDHIGQNDFDDFDDPKEQGRRHYRAKKQRKRQANRTTTFDKAKRRAQKKRNCFCE